MSTIVVAIVADYPRAAFRVSSGPRSIGGDARERSHNAARLIFEMDGTLTEPLLDFPRIKADLGIGDQPILEAMAKMDDERRREAESILHEHEDRAARDSTLNVGCKDLLLWIEARSLPWSIVTRNSTRCAEIVLEQHGIDIETLVTRDDGLFKPHPAPLLLACERMKVLPNDAWMIGDGQYDVEAGHAAGIRTVWLSHGRTRSFEAEPWKVVRDLPELHEFLRSL
jgi:HAD superfamily hydrolase (TIGR01549 family)